MAELDEHAAVELSLYVENDGDLHRRQGKAIERNLANKAALGKYDHKRAVDLFMYLMESGAKKYAREFATPGEWMHIFSVPTRRAVAENFALYFETEYRLGRYDHLLTGVSQKAVLIKARTRNELWERAARLRNA